MSRSQTGFHVRLKVATLAQVRAAYPWIIPARGDGPHPEVWRVEVTNGGYGRDAMHLLLVDKIGGEPVPFDGEPRRIVVWRGQVVGEPRCDYCGAEGHSASTGTAANCSVRAAEVKEQRETASRRMAARWAMIKAQAEAMKAEAVAAEAAKPPGPAYPREWDDNDHPIDYHEPIPDIDGPGPEAA